MASSIERLELRSMLAGDLGAGDANGDFFFDESDFVQVFRARKFEQGGATSWAEGDWNGDGIFNSSDFVEAFSAGLYMQGAYDDAASEPINNMERLATFGNADVTVYYETSSGSLAVVGEFGSLTSVQLRSDRSRFNMGVLPGLFDVSTSSRLFILDPAAVQAIQFDSVLPAGLTELELRADLRIDGSMWSGGGLGTVRLEAVDTLPEGSQSVLSDVRPTLVAGDSNGDLFFDEADFVLAMQGGKYEADSLAEWSEGDWNRDLEFNSSDLVTAFTNGTYMTGTYSQAFAGERINTLAPFATGEPADVTVYYDSETGSLTAVASSERQITTFHVTSASGQFSDYELEGLFDVSSLTSQFQFVPNGLSVLYASHVLPSGLTLDQVRADLMVDGSLQGGGGLGIVVLEDAANLPEEIPPPPAPQLKENNNPPRNNGGPADPSGQLIDISQANGFFEYDPVSGDISIRGIDSSITTIELISQSGIFVGTDSKDYTGGGLFDVATRYKFFKLVPDGFPSVDLPGIAKTGLTAEQIAEDISGDGATLPGGRLKVAFGMSHPSDAQPGDANVDYFFDESDILMMMKSGKFNAAINALWADGDWNDDFRFDDEDWQLLRNSDHYTQGAYSEAATEPIHDRSAIVEGDSGDVILRYDSATGDLHVNAAAIELTAIHLTSESAAFKSIEPTGDFDVSNESSYFAVIPDGSESLTISGLLPTGMDPSSLMADLRIDGALKDGGSIGQTVLTNAVPTEDFQPGDANKDYRVDSADIVQVVRNLGRTSADWTDGDFNSDGLVNTDDLEALTAAGFYDADGQPYRETGRDPQHQRQSLSATDQDVRLVYMPKTGSLVVLTKFELSSLHIRSAAGQLVPMELAEGDFGIDSATDFFAASPSGIDADEILMRLPLGLSRSQVLSDLSVDGTRLDGLPFDRVSLSVLRPAKLELHCKEILRSGVIIGDANLDSVFDSRDIVTVFQAGEYEDDKPGNSTWYDGDWNCDGEFNSADIIAAFQNGGFTFEARPEVAAAAIHHLVEMESESNANDRQFGHVEKQSRELRTRPRRTYEAIV